MINIFYVGKNDVKLRENGKDFELELIKHVFYSRK